MPSPRSVPITGSIDRVEKAFNNELEIIDFKTGGVYENNKSIKENPQMNIYALAVQKRYGKLPTRASLFLLETRQDCSIWCGYDAS